MGNLIAIIIAISWYLNDWHIYFGMYLLITTTSVLPHQSVVANATFYRYAISDLVAYTFIQWYAS